MINFVYQQDAYRGAVRSGTALRRSLPDAAVARFQTELHIDLRAMALTPHGFEHRG